MRASLKTSKRMTTREVAAPRRSGPRSVEERLAPWQLQPLVPGPPLQQVRLVTEARGARAQAARTALWHAESTARRPAGAPSLTRTRARPRSLLSAHCCAERTPHTHTASPEKLLLRGACLGRVCQACGFRLVHIDKKKKKSKMLLQTSHSHLKPGVGPQSST